MKTDYIDKKSFQESSRTTPAFQHKVQPRPPSAKTYPLTVYFDGDCPICRREIDLMKMFNRKDHLQFIDFSNSSYHATDHELNQCDLGRVIHARWSDGTIITGVDVFREMWEAIGLGFLARLSRRPLINTLLVKAYAWFAKNRLRLTGRA
jgi:predicted DCC family thiol-disulfide oxidoreductase YuxK